MPTEWNKPTEAENFFIDEFIPGIRRWGVEQCKIRGKTYYERVYMDEVNFNLLLKILMGMTPVDAMKELMDDPDDLGPCLDVAIQYADRGWTL